MALYHFNLRDGRGGVADLEGTDLPNLGAAKAHATLVARELLYHNELRSRAWQLDVYDEDGELGFVLPFASVDPTLDHLGGPLRGLVERLSESKRTITETMFGLESMRYCARAANARRTGRPYLTARFGQRVDTPPPALRLMPELRRMLEAWRV